MKKLAITVLCALSITACVSLPTYHPASKIGESGFSDQKIDETRYRVAFQGDASTPRHQVEDSLILKPRPSLK